MNIYIENKKVTLTSKEDQIIRTIIKSDICQILGFITHGKKIQLKSPTFAKQLVKKYSGDKKDETTD